MYFMLVLLLMSVSSPSIAQSFCYQTLNGTMLTSGCTGLENGVWRRMHAIQYDDGSIQQVKFNLAQELTYRNATVQEAILNLVYEGQTPSPALYQMLNSTDNTTLPILNGTIQHNGTVSNGTSSVNGSLPAGFSFMGDYYSTNYTLLPIGPGCSPRPCPKLNVTNGLVIMPERFWGLCGGCYDIGTDPYGTPRGCRSVCSFPRYPLQCNKGSYGGSNNGYPGAVGSCYNGLPGCYEGYQSASDCLAGTGSSSCTEVQGPNTRQDGSGRYGNWLWCPSGPGTIDPVICTSSGKISRNCIRNYKSGIPVGGDQIFCSQNACSSLSPCKCSYIALRESRLASGRNFTVLPVNVMEKQRTLKLDVTGEPAGPVEVTHLWDDSCVKVYVSPPEAKVDTVLMKSGLIDIHIAHGSGERFCQTVDMSMRTDYLDAITVRGDQLLKDSRRLVPGVVKCDKRIDNWDDLLNTSCMTDGQVTLIVLTSLLLIIAVISLVLMVLSLVIKVILHRREVHALKQGMEEQETELKSQFSQDVESLKTKVMSYFRRPPAALVLLMLVTTGSCYRCDNQLTISSTEEICTGATCKMYDTELIFFDKIGQTVCFSGYNVQALQLLSVDTSLILSPLYYTAEFETKTETHTRCRLAGACDPNACLGLMSDRSANGNLFDPEVVLRSGETYCSQVCKGDGLVRDGIDCGCVDVTPNCNYHGYGIKPINSEAMVMYVSDKIPLPKFRIFYKDGTTKTAEGSVQWETIKLDVAVFGSTDFQTPANSAFVVRDSSIRLALVSPAGQPRYGTIGDIQSSTELGLVNYEGSMVFDRSIMRSVTCEGKECSWTFEQSGLKSTKSYLTGPLPDTYSGIELSNSTKSRGKNIIVNARNVLQGEVKVMMRIPSEEHTVQVDSVCPKIKHSTDITGCNNCNESASMSITALSECSEGEATVRSKSCRQIMPSTVYLTKTEKDFVISCYGVLDMQKFEVCLQGISTECTTVESITWNEIAYNLTENGLEYQLDSDTNHHDDDQWSPFAVFKNFANGVANWLDWCLLVLYIIVIAGIFLLALWLMWPLIVRFLVWVRDALTKKKIQETPDTHDAQPYTAVKNEEMDNFIEEEEEPQRKTTRWVWQGGKKVLIEN